MKNRMVTLIAGATASGKSAYAINLAQIHNAAIINADSMQVYSDLRILTARPSKEEEQSTDHVMFGHVTPAKRYSVGTWLKDLESHIFSAELEDRDLILVGGTGLYFKAFEEGLSAIPTVPENIETDLEDLWDNGFSDEIRDELKSVDPEITRRIEQLDRHRTIRALGVFKASGKSMSHWLAQPVEPLSNHFSDIKRIVVDMPRDVLYKRINKRFDLMIEQGALEEVKRLKDMNLDPDLPAMHAIGVSALSDYLDGTLSLDEAINDSKQKSRNYAKRQLTWTRNQMSNWDRIPPN